MLYQLYVLTPLSLNTVSPFSDSSLNGKEGVLQYTGISTYVRETLLWHSVPHVAHVAQCFAMLHNVTYEFVSGTETAVLIAAGR